MRHTVTTARAMFRAEYGNSKNIITPRVLRYGWSGERPYELAQGEGMRQQPVWGVTVLTPSGERDYDTSQLFFALEDAEAFIRARFLRACGVED